MHDMTARQREVLDALRRLHDEHGFAPSLHEVASEVGVASASSVHHHLRRLEARGLVERRAGRPLSVRRLPAGPPA
jgi:repressor LexA